MDTNSVAEANDCRVDLPPDAFDDLDEGYLLCWANRGEGWAVGLLSYRPKPQDDLLALDYALNRGLPIIRFTPAELDALRHGMTVRTLSGRNRFLVTVCGV